MEKKFYLLNTYCLSILARINISINIFDQFNDHVKQKGLLAMNKLLFYLSLLCQARIDM